jgi:hypothetical protein
LSVFTAREVLNHMPLDLYMKVVGLDVVPDNLMAEPRLRFVVIQSFPSNVLQLNITASLKVLTCLLDKLASPSFGLLARPGKDKYFVRRVPTTLQLSDSVEIDLGMRTVFDLKVIWRYLETIDLLENSDPYSMVLWLKRWTITRRRTTHANHLVQKALETVEASCNVFFPNDLVELYGYERLDLVASLWPSASLRDASFDEFCRKGRLDVPLPMSLVQARHFTSLEDSFIAAKLTPNGFVHRVPISPKKLILDVRRRLYHKVRKDPGYQGMIRTLLAKRISELHPNSPEMALTTTELIWRFSVAIAGMTMSFAIGEWVEAMKKLFQFPISSYSVAAARNYLRNFRWDKAQNESYFYLSLFRAEVEVLRRTTFREECESAHESFKAAGSGITHRVAFRMNVGNFTFILCSTDVQCHLIMRAEDVDPDFFVRRIALPNLRHFSVELTSEEQPPTSGLENDLARLIAERSQCLALISFTLPHFRDLRIPALFLYSFVLHDLQDGTPYQELEQLFGHGVDEILMVLRKFDFVRRKPSISACLCVIADVFYVSSQAGHQWTTIDDRVDVRQREQRLHQVYDVIDFSPGIELCDLVERVPVMSLFDVLAVVECLELDELVYRVTSVNREGRGLFERDEEVLCMEIPDLRIGMEMATFLADPHYSRHLCRFFPTTVV